MTDTGTDTTADVPVKLVVDCSAAGGLPSDQADELAATLEQSALDLLRQADPTNPDEIATATAQAATLVRTANETRAASGVASETVVPLDNDEIAQRDTDTAEAATASAAAETADTNAATLRDKVDQALANLEAAGAGWANLTAAQKDAAMRLTVQATARLARLALNQLDAAP